MKWFPQPLLSVLLAGSWLALVNSLAAGQIALAIVIAILLPFGLQRQAYDPVRIHRPLRLLRFIALVAWDIVIANVQVAVQVLGPNRRLRPAFIELPLELRSEFALAVLASTITLTPGTVSVCFSNDRHTLLVHALHCIDPPALIAQIKQRYEYPLREIFEC